MDNADSGTTTVGVPMNRKVIRQPASAQISSRLGSLQCEGKGGRADAFVQTENEGIRAPGFKNSKVSLKQRGT